MHWWLLLEPVSFQLPEGPARSRQTTKAPTIPRPRGGQVPPTVRLRRIGSVLFMPEQPLSSPPEEPPCSPNCHSEGQLGTCSIKCRSLGDSQRAMSPAAPLRTVTTASLPVISYLGPASALPTQTESLYLGKTTTCKIPGSYGCPQPELNLFFS